MLDDPMTITEGELFSITYTVEISIVVSIKLNFHYIIKGYSKVETTMEYITTDSSSLKGNHKNCVV